MKTRPRRATHLGLEALERRALLAADPGWAFALAAPLNGDAVVDVAPDGSVYAAGAFQGTVDFDPGAGTFNLTSGGSSGDGFVAKYTHHGGLVWATRFGGTSLDYATALDVDAAGNVYLTGHSTGAAPMQFGAHSVAVNGSYDAFAAKLNGATGVFEWARGVGGALQDTAYDIQVSDAGDVYVSGTFRATADFDPGAGVHSLTEAGNSGAGDSFLWKLTSNGALQWAKQYGNEYLDNGHRVLVADGGGLYAAGTYRGTVDYGQPGNPLVLTAPKTNAADLYLLKLDEVTGDALWARQATGLEHINAAWIAADATGGVYFAGGFNGTINFGAGTPSLTSAGASDVFVSQWDAGGNITWAKSVAVGAGAAIPASMEVTPAGSLVFGIEFYGVADFDPGVGTASLTSAGGTDGAVLMLNADGSFGWVRQTGGAANDLVETVVADAAGNVYAAGLFQTGVNLPTGHAFSGSYGTFLMKLAFGDAATKFYVVDDASANRTFEYEATGAAAANSALNTGNSAPRGAASTAVGDKVWVVDANRKVYVYDKNGNLLGSWTAGTMASNATPEGIATNGTDVWIVDSKSDKVYRYAGAATRLSGSQNAASSFNLNSGNTSPKDIVTDGASLWVVNDASSDKVFKYAVSGSLQGNWTITGAGSQPTGITLDPANVSDLWIVDNGTDRVYQFAAAASRTSGSQAPLASFALAAGNTNPQGIADPPPRSAALTVSDAPQHEVSRPWRPNAVLAAADLHSAPQRKSFRDAGRSAAFAELAPSTIKSTTLGIESLVPRARGSQRHEKIAADSSRNQTPVALDWDAALESLA
jgi:hypothetical protein